MDPGRAAGPMRRPATPNEAKTMKRSRVLHAAIAAATIGAAAFAPAAAAAATCYIVYDRGGEILYRGFDAPFDGAADPSTPGRTAMRERGEHLVHFDADVCVPVARTAGPGGRAATVDEIVAGFPAYGSLYGGRAQRTDAGFVDAPSSSGPGNAGTGGPAARIASPAASAVQMRPASYR